MSNPVVDPAPVVDPVVTPPADPPVVTPPAPADPPVDPTDWKAEARKWEARAKANAPAKQPAQAAPVEPPADPGPSPELVAAQEQAATTARENLILRTAPALNADADALLDSSSFMAEVAKLDPTADDYKTKVETAIKAAITARPNLAAGPARAGRSGNPVGGSGNPGTLEEQIAEATKARDFPKVFALKQQLHAK